MRPMRKGATIVGWALPPLAILLAACGTTVSSGTLAGTFRIVGGGVAYHTVPGHGAVVVRDGERTVRTMDVRSGHDFAVSLPAGSYRVSVGCEHAAVRVAVEADKSSGVRLRCIVSPAIG